MIEFKESEQGGVPDRDEFGIKVIGVGGAGANVLDRMALEGSDEAELLTLNTDVRALSTSVSSDKIQLGTTLLKGMGTGGDPSLGKQSAIEAVDEIREAVRGHKMVFVCVGLGGGTGSGAAPEVCRIAKEEGVFLVAFATMPFSFEGERRTDQAKEALTTIGKYANAVITFDNDRMGELIVPKDGVTQAFSAADKIISQSIRATINVVFRPGIIRIGMDDLLSALESHDSRCLFGYGVAKGDNRSHEAVEQALKCPLLDRGKLLNDARAVLVQVAGGDNMTLFEVQMVMEEITKHVSPSTQILFGTGTDKRLSNSLSVTIISSIAGPDAAAMETVAEEESSATPAVSLGMASLTPESEVPVEEFEPIEEFQPEPEPELESEPELEPAAVEEEQVFESEEFAEPEAEVALGEEPETVQPPVAADEESVFEELEEEEDAAVFEPIEDEEAPSYAPPELDDSFEEEEGDEDLRNPIARAMSAEEPEFDVETSTQPISRAAAPAPAPEAAPSAQEPGVDRVEATTESSQKIRLSRVFSNKKTGRIKTRDSAASKDGPALPPSKAPTLPPETVEPAELSDDAKQQQEMLQLEPVAGKGRFAKTDPTIVDGEDLDVPTFLRKKK